MNPKIDEYLAGEEKWHNELVKLREIVLNCQLNEELKWGVPCYTFQSKNIVLIHAFKEYCALLFIKGSLLQDPSKLLFQQTENVQAGRQIRFTSLSEIVGLTAELKAYIYEAIEVEKAGLKVPFKKLEDFNTPEEFTQILSENPPLAQAFDALTPGRKKAYLLHFSGAKQAATRISRIEACTSRIMKGKGLNDCICGLSKRMPNCDGSHKQLNK